MGSKAQQLGAALSEIVQEAIAGRRDVNKMVEVSASELVRTPLMVACLWRNYNTHLGTEFSSDTIAELLKAGADPNTSCPGNGATALFFAVMYTDIQSVDLLLNARADVQARDKLGRSLLFNAAESCDPDIIERLLERGVDPAERSDRIRANNGSEISLNVAEKMLLVPPESSASWRLTGAPSNEALVRTFERLLRGGATLSDTATIWCGNVLQEHRTSGGSARASPAQLALAQAALRVESNGQRDDGGVKRETPGVRATSPQSALSLPPPRAPQPPTPNVEGQPSDGRREIAKKKKVVTRRVAGQKGTEAGLGIVLRKIKPETCFRIAAIHTTSYLVGNPNVNVGDIVVSIDGIDIKGYNEETIMHLIRGEPETRVELVLEDDGMRLATEETEQHYFLSDFDRGQWSVILQWARNGLGLHVSKTANEEYFEVTAVDPQGPADTSSKVRVGDLLLAIQGKPLHKYNAEQVHSMLQGPVGQRAQLTMGETRAAAVHRAGWCHGDALIASAVATVDAANALAASDVPNLKSEAARDANPSDLAPEAPPRSMVPSARALIQRTVFQTPERNYRLSLLASIQSEREAFETSLAHFDAAYQSPQADLKNKPLATPGLTPAWMTPTVATKVVTRRVAGQKGTEAGLGIVLRKIEGETCFRIAAIHTTSYLVGNPNVNVGDIVVSVDGIDIKGYNEETIMHLIRGEPETRVELVLVDDGMRLATEETEQHYFLSDFDRGQWSVILQWARNGLGLHVSKTANEEYFEVTAVDPQGPADTSSKVRVGDLLLAIQGKPLHKYNAAQVHSMLQGPVGQRAQLTMGETKAAAAHRAARSPATTTLIRPKTLTPPPVPVFGPDAQADTGNGPGLDPRSATWGRQGRSTAPLVLPPEPEPPTRRPPAPPPPPATNPDPGSTEPAPPPRLSRTSHTPSEAASLGLGADRASLGGPSRDPRMIFGKFAASSWDHGAPGRKLLGPDRNDGGLPVGHGGLVTHHLGLDSLQSAPQPQTQYGQGEGGPGEWDTAMPATRPPHQHRERPRAGPGGVPVRALASWEQASLTPSRSPVSPDKSESEAYAVGSLGVPDALSNLRHGLPPGRQAEDQDSTRTPPSTGAPFNLGLSMNVSASYDLKPAFKLRIRSPGNSAAPSPSKSSLSLSPTSWRMPWGQR